MRKLLLALSLFSASLAADEFPMVIDPIINATPPGAKVSAGYFSMTNKSDKTFTLTGVSSPDITKVEIHLSSIENDVAKMEKQESISIEPGDTLAFEHGGYHLMLMGLSEPLKPGDVIDIILSTSNGDMLIEMPVVKMGSSMEKMNHDDMNMEEGMDKDDTLDPKKDGDAHEGSTKVVH